MESWNLSNFAHLFALAQRQTPLLKIDSGIMDLDFKMTVSELLTQHQSKIQQTC